MPARASCSGTMTCKVTYFADVAALADAPADADARAEPLATAAADPDADAPAGAEPDAFGVVTGVHAMSRRRGNAVSEMRNFFMPPGEHHACRARARTPKSGVPRARR